MIEDAQKLAALEEELRKDLDAISRVRRLMESKSAPSSKPDERQLPLIINKRTPRQSEEDTGEGPADIGTVDNR